MAEQESDLQKEKATIDWVLAMSGGNRDIIVREKVFTVRPLTWKMERDIAATTANMQLRGIPESVADREYAKLVVHFCLVEPALDESQVEGMDVKVIKDIFDNISEMSSSETSKKS